VKQAFTEHEEKLEEKRETNFSLDTCHFGRAGHIKRPSSRAFLAKSIYAVMHASSRLSEVMALK